MLFDKKFLLGLLLFTFFSNSANKLQITNLINSEHFTKFRQCKLINNKLTVTVGLATASYLIWKIIKPFLKNNSANNRLNLNGPAINNINQVVAIPTNSLISISDNNSANITVPNTNAVNTANNTILTTINLPNINDNPLSSDPKYNHSANEMPLKSEIIPQAPLAATTIPSVSIKESKEQKEEKETKEDHDKSCLEKDINEKIQSDENLTPENIFSKIQKLCDISILKDSKYLAEILEIDISSYPVGPFLFEQIFLEHFNKLKNKIKLYNSFLAKFSPNEKQKINKEKLKKAMNDLKTIYKSGPWYKGRLIVQALLNGKSLDEFRKTTEEHWQNIVHIVWYFHEIAIKKTPRFIECTYNIENKTIFDFLVSYKYTYDRSGKFKSSHYREIDKERFGLNIPTNKRNEWSYPNNKVHLLFGDISGLHLIDNARFIFFLKPETYPLENPEFPNHCNFDGLKHYGDWFLSIGRKIGIGSDDELTMRKERVPLKIFEAFKELYYSFVPAEKSSIFGSKPPKIKFAQTHGIKAMVNIINKDFANPTNETQIKAKEEFMKLIKEYDHINLRKGREIIIISDEIQQDLNSEK